MLVRVTAQNGLNVRSKPSKNSKPVRVLAYGKVVKCGGEKRGWLEIEDGWIMKEYTEEVIEEVAEPTEIIEEANEPIEE